MSFILDSLPGLGSTQGNSLLSAALLITGLSATVLGLLLLLYGRHAVGSFPKPHPSNTIMRNSFPLIGHLVLALSNRMRMHDFVLEETLKSSKKTMYISLPFTGLYYFITTPAQLEYVLKTKFESFVKGPTFHGRMEALLGNGIFTSDGERWKKQRKIAANIFNVNNFKEFVGKVFQEEMVALDGILDQHAAQGSLIDLSDRFYRFTLDGFAEIAFSIQLHSMTAKTQVPFALAFDRSQIAAKERFFWPFWRYTEWLTNPQLKHDTAFVREYCMKIVQQRREDIRKTDADFAKSDILQLFIKHAEDRGEELSDEDLADHTINFIIAGRDTTAQALSWCFYLLAKNPDKCDELLKEIESKNLSPMPSYDEIRSLRYANAVFSETLRLYPSVPQNIKECLKEETLPDGTIIPKGAFVTWNPYAMGRTPAIWGDDAREFRPERWLDRAKPPTNFEYPSFNAGPRLCLGLTMAYLEGVFVIVQIVRKYKIEVLNLDTITYNQAITLPMKDPMMCRIHRR
ncbi:cytochrome P450 [Cladochytrium replicatum]|nr:cytochrome P450 [Cladochytrium replicatum]